LDKLWAPWRIKYIVGHKDKKCVFCKAYKDTNDKKNFVIHRSRHCFAIINIFPYNNGHIMIVTNRHIKYLKDISDNELFDLTITARKLVGIIKTALSPEGFNIGMNVGSVSGAGIDSHLHMHIVPRWQGDTNFMPVLSDTKIISQSTKELYTILRKCLQKKK